MTTYFYYDSVVYRKLPGAFFERWIGDAWQSASGDHPMSQEEHLRMQPISEAEARKRMAA